MNNSPENEKLLITYSAVHQWGPRAEPMCRREKAWPFIHKH